MLIVRLADDLDLDAVTRIYATHVTHGLGTFEEKAPTRAEMAERREAVIRQSLPYLVAEVDGAVAGFAYASTFRTRSGYRFTAEDSVYVAPEFQGKGVGRTLLTNVVRGCETQGVRQLVAFIGDSGNQASIALHKGAGFQRTGLMPAVGFKHGRWVDVVIMQAALNGGDEAPPNLSLGLQALA